jgi:hypothetical protein
MTKPTAAVRMNITVPGDVKSRMDTAKDVNWSAVASEAFRAKLLDLESRKAAGTMTEVVERLRASQAKRENEQHQQGAKAGRAWAKEDAEAHQLERLASGPPEKSYEWAGWLGVYDNGQNAGVAKGLYQDICGRDADGDWRDVREYWDRVLGDHGSERIADHDFALGFIEGALEVWDAVKDKL